jgi:hypothetical protein
MVIAKAKNRLRKLEHLLTLIPNPNPNPNPNPKILASYKFLRHESLQCIQVRERERERETWARIRVTCLSNPNHYTNPNPNYHPDSNTNSRTRDKERYRLRKQTRKNDVESFRKLQQIKKDFSRAQVLIQLVLERETLKEAEFHIQKEIFDQAIFDLNPENLGKKRKLVPFRHELQFPHLFEVTVALTQSLTLTLTYLRLVGLTLILTLTLTLTPISPLIRGS